MAAAAHDDDEMITGINVTPLVDITLVLLVILMVTASYVASKAIPLDLPKGATAETTPTTLSVSIDKDGKTYLEAAPIDDAGAAREGARGARRRSRDARGDRRRRAGRPRARGPRHRSSAPRRGHEVRHQRRPRRLWPLTQPSPASGERGPDRVTTWPPPVHSRAGRERQRGRTRKRQRRRASAGAIPTELEMQNVTREIALEEDGRRLAGGEWRCCWWSASQRTSRCSAASAACRHAATCQAAQAAADGGER